MMNSLRNCVRLAVKHRNVVNTNYTVIRNFRRTLRPTLMELTKRKRQNMKIQPPKIRSNFLEWNRASELYAFNIRLSEKFDDKLLDQAFTHKSYIEQEEAKRKELGVQESALDIEDNTKLIAEGKAILPKVIQNYLSRALPFAPRECIIAFTNYLLDTKHLAHVSSGIGTKDLILCSTHPVPDEILADTFYALIAALKNSTDLLHTSVFIRDILIATLVEKDFAEIWYPQDPLRVLNSIFVREGKGPAEPRLVAESGTNTLLAVYQVAIYSKRQFLGIGVGNTIAEATDMAAINSLMRIFRLMDCSQPLRCNLKVSDNLEEPIPNLPLNEWTMSKLAV